MTLPSPQNCLPRIIQVLGSKGAAAAVAAKSLQSCLTFCDPIDEGNPPGSSVHGIFQARVLEWGAIAFSEQRCRRTEIIWIAGKGPCFWVVTVEHAAHWWGILTACFQSCLWSFSSVLALEQLGVQDHPNSSFLIFNVPLIFLEPHLKNLTGLPWPLHRSPDSL